MFQMGHRPQRSDLLVIAGFIRPLVLLRGLQLGRPSLSRWSPALMMTISGLVVEPLAWLQSLLIRRQLRALRLPPDPIVVIGHWRSGTTYMHQLLTSTRRFERLWLHVTQLAWLHAGAGRSHLLIKNPAHSARVPMVLKHFPKARFIFLEREPIDSIRSLVQVKQRMSGLIGLQPLPDQITQVEDTATAHHELMQAFEASRPLIPKGQLVEVAFSDLVRQPFDEVKRIYETFGLRSWNSVQAHIRQRIEQSATYHADPVVLERPAEQRLRELMGVG